MPVDAGDVGVGVLACSGRLRYPEHGLKRSEVSLRPVVGGVMDPVRSGQNHAGSAYGLEHLVAVDGEADNPTLSIASGSSLGVPPTTVAEMPDRSSMRPLARLAAPARVAVAPAPLTAGIRKMCKTVIGKRSPDEATAEASRPTCTCCKDASCPCRTPSQLRNSHV